MLGRKQLLPATFILCSTTALMLFVNSRLLFFASDDSYIQRRIVDNFVRTGHAVFNPGEVVMSTSAPLWTLFLAANKVLFRESDVVPVWNALFVGIAACACYLLVTLAASNKGSVKGWDWYASVMSYLVACILVQSSIEQMETPLAVALLLLAAVCFAIDDSRGLVFILLGAFIRLELSVLFGITFLSCMCGRRITARLMTALGVIGLSVTSWLILQFGSIIPNSVTAKRIGYVISHRSSLLSMFPLGSDGVPADTPLVFLVVLSAVSAVAMQFFFIYRRRQTVDSAQLVSVGFSGWGLLLALLYLAAKTLVFSWYQPLVVVPIVVGVAMAIPTNRSVAFRVVASYGIAILAYAWLMPSLTLMRAALISNYTNAVGFSEAARVHEYLVIGDAVRDVCPASQLMTSEVGGLGYSFGGYIVDGFGLVSPGALKYQPLPVPAERIDGSLGAIPPDFVRERKPDLIVAYDVFAEAVLKSPWVRSEYVDFSYPALLPADSSGGQTRPWLWIARMHVLIKRDGNCDPQRLNQQLSTRFLPAADKEKTTGAVGVWGKMPGSSI